MQKIIVKAVDLDIDINTVEVLAHEIWSQHYLPIIGQAQIDYMLGKYQSFKAIKKNLQDGYIYYIAYYKEKPCGYCAIKSDAGIFLSKFYVKESCRGIGLGRKMIEVIYDFAKKQNKKRIWLTCNKNNSQSLAVYKKFGFSIINSVVTDIGNDFVMDDYVLERRI